MIREDIDDDEKAIITLEQIASRGMDDIQYRTVEEGDVYGDFKVVDISSVKCDHPDVRWSIPDHTDGEVPEVEGTCVVCGEEFYGDIEITHGEL